MIHALISPILLWVLFIAYTALHARWETLRPEVKCVGGLVILAGLALDVAFNWTVGLLLGGTRDFTFSQKCGRLKRGDDWRAPVACYICRAWLDPFELGGHCK